jgi:hypothetical protein
VEDLGDFASIGEERAETAFSSVFSSSKLEASTMTTWFSSTVISVKQYGHAS